MPSEHSLRKLCEIARERRLSGTHHDEGPLPLTGYCFDNAYVLTRLLEEHGYDPEPVVGASDRYSEEVLRENPIESLTTIDDLAGYVHYWVEVEGTVLDIAADVPGSVGSILVQESLPTAYHRLEDSYERAAKSIASARDRRCDSCGGRQHWCSCSGIPER